MEIHDKLIEMGYFPLKSDGETWRTKAVFRGGRNTTALIVSKNDGFWHDFGTGKSGPFSNLVKLTTGEDNFKCNQFNVEVSSVANEINSPSIKMNKTWSNSELETLVPHYKFYEEKGISSEILKSLSSGLQHEGPMHGRFVFPIFDESKKIIGWSGRDMTEKWKDGGAKWKHIGAVRSWVYPAFVLNKTGEAFILNEIKEKKQVILVESIGDMLALWSAGIKNVIVTFGLKISPAIIKFLMSYGINHIIISFNNDDTSECNNGKVGAYASFVKLMSTFDLESLSIKLPLKNDFGEMSEIEIAEWSMSALNKSIDVGTAKEVFDFLKEKYLKNGQDGKSITKEEMKHARTIKQYIESNS